MVILLLGATATSAGPAFPILTVTGEECLLPAVYGGQVITSCVELGDGLYCPVVSGRYELCAGGQRAGDVPNSEANAVQRRPLLSTSGQACQTPLYLNSVAVNSCISVAHETVCWVSTPGDGVGGTFEGCLVSPSGVPGDIGSASTPVVPSITRLTIDGEPCVLPRVTPRGVLLSDCEAMNGLEVCQTINGTLQICAPHSASEAAATELVYGERTTISGEPCQLPFVADGFVYMDCSTSVGVPTAEEGSCPTEDGDGYAACAAPGPVIGAFDYADVFRNRTLPGREGTLCGLVPQGDAVAEGCDDDLVCLPLQASTGFQQFMDLGFCAPPPTGGVFGLFATLQATGAPEPVAFFPLTDRNDLDSILLPHTAGEADGVEFVDDAVFGTTPYCQDDENSTITLDSVAYMSSGPFALNLWVALETSQSSSGLRWVYSHTNGDHIAVGFPNQVLLFFAEDVKDNSPILVALVSDGSDGALDPNRFPAIQSDGTIYNSTIGRNVTEKVDFGDGNWHMITITTEPRPGQLGFQLYVDGGFAGDASDQIPGLKMNELPGGEPGELGKPIYLCTSISGDERNVLNGYVSNLALFNEALTPEQIRAIRSSYIATSENGQG